ncbi:MAG: DUF1156 domain-containing protein [Bacteroidota bacterium]
MSKAPKKIIEVSLPLDDINAGASYEKKPGIGAHPRGIHHWWARRPFAVARALLFAQLVNDPGGHRGWGNYRGQTKEIAEKERLELFDIIKDLSNWKKTYDLDVIKKAQEEIKKSYQETMDLTEDDELSFLSLSDPFAGGGAIPFEAQRLGLKTYASDLNPVSVITLKAMMDIPHLLKNVVHNTKDNVLRNDKSILNLLSSEVYKYGQLLNINVKKKINHLFPEYEITKDICDESPHLSSYRGEKLTVVAYIWCRTVKSPSPAHNHIHVPLASSFVLSKKNNNSNWVYPSLSNDGYCFKIMNGAPPDEAKNGTKIGRGANFRCLMSDSVISDKYIKSEGKNKRISYKMMAVVLQGRREKVYAPPIDYLEDVSISDYDISIPSADIPRHPQYIGVMPYGYDKFNELFTDRQLIAFDAYIKELDNIKLKCYNDLISTGLAEDGKGLNENGAGPKAFSEAIIVYLSLVISRCANFNNNLTLWASGNEKIMFLFNRQAMPMAWDFGEANIIENVVGGFPSALNYITKCIKTLDIKTNTKCFQADAKYEVNYTNKIIHTDPPYYDNVPYSDLSDFFYIWLRRCLNNIFPQITKTIVAPKSEELVADVKRHNGADNAENYFMDGMKIFFNNIYKSANDNYPIAIYYAFRGSSGKDNKSNKGWSSFLNSIIDSGFMITGTWPLRTETTTALKSKKNFLASSILIVCRKRNNGFDPISKRDFIKILKEELPEALDTMIGGRTGNSPIAPVDLAQSAIGPGMSIYSRYPSIMEADGSKMCIDSALRLT